MQRSNRRIDSEATDWVIRSHTRALSAEEQAELDRWLEANPRHRGAYLRASAAWIDLDRLASMAGPRELPQENGAAAPPRFVSRRVAIAAGIAVVVLGGLPAWWAHRHYNVYVSDAGQVRQVALSDGSHMVLNTETRATVQFDDTHREIELARGEGFFQVARDPARPFVVRTGAILVRAIGTVFSVRSSNHRVDVTVSQGLVELVDSSNPEHVIRRRLGANEHATVEETHRVEVQRLEESEVSRRLGWREGLLDFEGQPLLEAVNEMNRRNHKHIVVDDPQLAARPVVGQFLASDPAGFAATVAVALGAQSVEQDDAIHLRRVN
ncbi:MAG: FecR domain-containing protein [Proteobacteria bacterium]|nr:FecR domain-containing protein [Pseudomonadota bacterium]